MKSVVLCEGKDDHWFIAYYLHKVAGWDTCDSPWSSYKILAKKHQKVTYMEKGNDSVAIWCVGGKNCFDLAVSTIFTKFIADYPIDPIDSIVIVQDRDDDTIDDVLTKMQGWIPPRIALTNKEASIWNTEIEGYDLSIKITPLVIPFLEAGAIETLLLESISEQDSEGKVIVAGANEYIDNLLKEPLIGER